MSFIDGLRHRLYVLLRGERYSNEIERELRFHVELDQLSRAEYSAPQLDAELRARRAIGNVTYYREEVRRMTVLGLMDRTRQDLSYAWRGLRRSPAFTATVIITLGLGLGVNAAMYSFIEHVFFRHPAGVVEPKQVRRIYAYQPGRLSATGGRSIAGSYPYPSYAAMRELVDDRRSIAAFTEPESVAVLDSGRVFSTRRSFVSAHFFSLLGVRPQQGRFFTDDEDPIDQLAPVAVISDELWRRVFNRDPAALGRMLIVGKTRHTIVGVASKDFVGVSLDRADIWLPLNAFPGTLREGKPWYTGRGNYFRIIARAATPTIDERIRATATAGYRRGMEEAYRRRDSTSVLLSGPLAESRGPADQQKELTVSTRLAGVSLLVLAIACANVANMLIVRASRRRREISVRRALGVSKRRLLSQLLTESLLLATIAGIVAVLFAFWGADVLRRMLLPNVHWASGAVNVPVLAFTALAALFVGVIAGLAPALHALRPNLVDALRAGSREGAYQRSWLRGALLCAQAALSIVLVVGATLFARSLRNVETIDIGYDTHELISAKPYYDDRRREDAPDVRAAVALAARELQSVAGVEAVALAESAPLRGNSGFPVFLPSGASLPRETATNYPTGLAVAPEFFATVGLRVLSGRALSVSDQQFVAGNIPARVVVTAAFAKSFWPGESAVGKCVIFGKQTNPCTTIVGVVEDARLWRILEATPLLYYYPGNALGETTVLVRTNDESAARVKEHVGRVLSSRLPGTPYVRVARMTEDIEPQLRPWRLGAKLFGAMSVLALIVAAIGIYSVVAYAVSQRTHEMGVRIALGARVSDILDLVMVDGLRPVILGILLGIAASLALGRFVSSLLFGVTAYDASAMLTASSALCLLGLLASVIPGIRAARVDPATALRAE
jgi:predicted permease